MIEFFVESLAEDALLLRFGDSIDPRINACVHAAAERLRSVALPVCEVAPAYASLSIRFDPLAWTDARKPNEAPHARLLDAIESVLRGSEEDEVTETGSRTIEIPVCYGGGFGPDLEEAARHAQLDPREFIARHAAAEYTVAMLGFAPGFPYLLGLDTALHTPRRATPRTRVPRGSVAIGGAQTGIYPRELSGGWQIIGRSPSILFDADREPPCLLEPGDRVRFRMIETDEFTALESNSA